MPHPSQPSRTGKLLLVFLALLLFNSIYLAISNRLPEPPRQVILAFFYMGNVMLHLLLGLGAILILLKLGAKWRQAIRETEGAGKLPGALSVLGLMVCNVAGIGLLIFGNLRPQANILLAHGLGALIAAGFGAMWLMARASSTSRITSTSTTVLAADSPSPPLVRTAPLRPAAALICIAI